jgi:hypothetical protein
LHSFEFREAEVSFRKVEKEDPKCVIAAWGVALSTTERAGANAPPKDLSKGWEELTPWLTVRAGTEREQMYVDAVRAMYEGYATVPGSKRWQGYLARMEELRKEYPMTSMQASSMGLASPGQQDLEKKGYNNDRRPWRSFCRSSADIQTTRVLLTTSSMLLTQPNSHPKLSPQHKNMRPSRQILRTRSTCRLTSSID